MSDSTLARGINPPLPKHWAGLAFAWGLAEATFFFVVPDVFTTRLALQDYRRALVSCLAAVAGALMGGTVLWLVADYEVGPRLLRAFLHLPGINLDLVASTGQSVFDQGAGALFFGMLRGEPYKLFAVHAGVQGVPFAAFFAISAVARLARFAITATLAGAIGRIFRGQPMRLLFQIHALVWLGFYLVYFVLRL